MKTTYSWLLCSVITLACCNLTAAIFTVTTTNVSGPGSLPVVINQANAAPGNNTIQFTVTNPITLEFPLATVTNNLTIRGRTDVQTVISGGGAVPIFTFAAGTTNTVFDLILVNAQTSGGGAAINNAGSLYVSGCLFTNNFATSGAGGAVSSAGNITIVSSIISGNQAANGGAIYSLGTLSVSNSQMFNNRAGKGGAMYNAGLAKFDQLVISNNLSKVGFGGAIYNAGNLSMTRATLSQNQVTGSTGMPGQNGSDGSSAIPASSGSGGGGAGGGAGGLGGGLYVGAGTVTATNCTFYGNLAQGGNGSNGGNGGHASGFATYFGGNGGAGGNGGSGGAGGLNYFGADGQWGTNGGFAGGGGGGGGGSAGGAGQSPGGAGARCGSGGFAGGNGGWGGDGGAYYGSATDGFVGGGGNGGWGLGGGVFVQSGDVVLAYCTFTANSAGGGLGGSQGTFGQTYHTNRDGSLGQGVGGGIYNYSGTVALFNTIVAGNAVSNSSPDLNGAVASSGVNLIGNNQGAIGLSINDFQNVPANLGPLRDNGGPTLTCAPLPGSFAIGYGTSAGAPPVDQRGVPRPQNSAFDIGAVEFVSTPLLTGPLGLGTSGFSLSTILDTTNSYRIRGSTNLTAWVDLTNYQSGGPQHFLDGSSTNLARRFYRAVAP